MALTQSNPFPLGAKAPDFNLPDVISGNSVSLKDIKGDKGTVIMFICNHCPYVVHVNEALVRIADHYQKKGIAFVGINSNDVSRYPDDSPQKMKKIAEQESYCFPYLYDESQDVARAYDAACTPEFYVVDEESKLVYHGQMDDSRPGNSVPVDGKDLCMTLDLLMDGKSISKNQKPGIGCGIKWKI